MAERQVAHIEQRVPYLVRVVRTPEDLAESRELREHTIDFDYEEVPDRYSVALWYLEQYGHLQERFEKRR